MKRKRTKLRSVWIDITFSITIILLTLGAIYLVFNNENGHTASPPDKVETITSSPIKTEQLDSNYPGIKIITKTSNDENAPFAIQYPQSIHNSFNTEVKNYIDEAQAKYLELIYEKKLVDQQITGELNISYETLPHTSGNYSFVLVNNSSFSDNDSGQTEIRSFHLNPKTGQIFSIRDLLEGDSHRLHNLSSLVRKTIQEDESLKGHLSYRKMERYLEPRWVNYRNFAITDEALIIYFDEDTIANSIVGPPIISIPIETVQVMFAPSFNLETEEDSIVVEGNTENSEENNDDNKGGLEAEPNTADSEASSAGKSIKKKVALTFDDGPDPKVTRQILDTLQNHEAIATFFMLGSRVEYYPDIVNEIKEAGHELGNHTWTHADLTKLSPERIAKEIDKTSAIIEEVSGQKVEAFRPPYGSVNEQVYNTSGLPVVLWDVDTLDWKYRDPARILQIVKEQVKDGSIILMHDIHQSTADGLDAVLTYLKEEGFEFVTIEELETPPLND